MSVLLHCYSGHLFCWCQFNYSGHLFCWCQFWYSGQLFCWCQFCQLLCWCQLCYSGQLFCWCHTCYGIHLFWTHIVDLLCTIVHSRLVTIVSYSAHARPVAVVVSCSVDASPTAAVVLEQQNNNHSSSIISAAAREAINTTAVVHTWQVPCPGMYKHYCTVQQFKDKYLCSSFIYNQ